VSSVLICFGVAGALLCCTKHNSAKNNQIFYNKIYSRNISFVMHWKIDETVAQKSPKNDKKYKTVTINTSLFQSSNFFPQEGIAPSGSGNSYYWGYAITLRHTTLMGLLWISDQTNSKTST
jgi:hypothetical protein